MKSAFAAAASAILLVSLASNAVASDYDNCILTHLQGVTSDIAAVSIKEACIHTVEATVPDDIVAGIVESARASPGWRNFYNQQTFGLDVTFDNDTEYTLTEIALEIVNNSTGEKERYVLRHFEAPLPPNVFITSPAPDRTVSELLTPGGRKEFFCVINQTVKDPQTWGKAYTWNWVATKGFKN